MGQGRQQKRVDLPYDVLLLSMSLSICQTVTKTNLSIETVAEKLDPPTLLSHQSQQIDTFLVDVEEYLEIDLEEGFETFEVT